MDLEHEPGLPTPGLELGSAWRKGPQAVEILEKWQFPFTESVVYDACLNPLSKGSSKKCCHAFLQILLDPDYPYNYTKRPGVSVMTRSEMLQMSAAAAQAEARS